MRTTYSAGLRVEDFAGDAASLSQFLQLEPTDSSEPGIPPDETGSWQYELNSEPGEELDALLLRLLESLEGHWERIGELAERTTVYICCGVFYYSAYVSYILCPATLLQLAGLGLDVEICTHPCTEGDEEAEDEQ